MKTLTPEQVREAVRDVVTDVIAAFSDEPETDREQVIERLDEECDDLFGSLVRHGRVDQYDVDDLIDTAQPCGVILQVAQLDAWVEDDSGLWDGLQFGVLASIAFFSLRNLLYSALAQAGHDTNNERPFAVVTE